MSTVLESYRGKQNMSIDVKIIPTRDILISWGNLRKQLSMLADSDEQKKLLGQIRLFRGSDGTDISESESIQNEQLYVFSNEMSKTLSFHSTSWQGSTEEDVREYLSDYGEHLSDEQLTDYAQKWITTGIYYIVTSKGGRSEQEPSLLVKLSVALANICSGYIILQDSDVFSLNAGIYSPEQFKNARVIER
jgi:hypothetical protein